MTNERDWLTKKRVFPRMFSAFYLWMFYEVNQVFWSLPAPTDPQGIAYAAFSAAAAAWFKFYVETGND